MEVTVDNVWATPSTLHMRVTVWGPGHKWRHRYDAAVPVSEIPEEAVAALVRLDDRDETREDLEQDALW